MIRKAAQANPRVAFMNLRLTLGVFIQAILTNNLGKILIIASQKSLVP
jgi:hypothetical protein